MVTFSMGRPGVVANPAIIVSSRLRFGLARQVRSSCPEPARLFSTLGPKLVLAHGITLAFRDGVQILYYRQSSSSGLSRVYQVNVKQIASRWHSLLDSIREFAWTGPVVLKVFE